MIVLVPCILGLPELAILPAGDPTAQPDIPRTRTTS
jgi:hypothetical protein